MTYLELYRIMEPEVLARVVSVGCPNKGINLLAPVPCLEKRYNAGGKGGYQCNKCLTNLFGQEVPPQVMIYICGLSNRLNDLKPPDQRPAIGESMFAKYLDESTYQKALSGEINIPGQSVAWLEKVNKEKKSS